MRLSSLPRFPLAHLPTPLEEAPNLSRAIGGPTILIKRDDLTGLALGGNKTRKLEYLVADARQQGVTVLITAGSTDSNHCRQTAAAARVAGMRCVLVQNETQPNPPAQGNYLLDLLLGADIRFVESEAARPAIMEQVAAELREEGETPYIIPGGGSNAVGASAYVAAVYEIVEQLVQLERMATRLYVTSSSSAGTHAGLALGAKLANAPFDVIGISVEESTSNTKSIIEPLANDTAYYLETGVRISQDELIVDDRFVGPGYAIPTPECFDAIVLAARTEGLLLDPVYTGKTLAGLISHARSGEIGPDETVIFLHTGGTPTLFAQADLITERARRQH
ncbi:MAG TPA: D-cysteine desulfhydrase family protein [Thermomicrobiaceae bacterium]|nr:D-cysteine desulfhydrase family protein [Thermomicrobiaceae bacterium]